MSREPRTQTSMDNVIQQRKLEVLFKQTPIIIVFVMLAAGLLCISLRSSVSATKLWAFFSMQAGAFIIRGLVVLGFSRRRADMSLEAWARAYMVTLGAAALAWSGGGLWLCHGTAPDVKLLVYVYLVGLGIGGVATYAAMRTSVVIAAIVLLAPMTVMLLFEDLASLKYAGVAGVLLIFAALRSSRVVSDTFEEAYRASLELEREKRIAERMARTDLLTGLHNRRSYTDLAEKALANGRRRSASCGLLIIDLDHFKRVNDTFGHATGDRCLRAVAQSLEGTLRRGDICGRFGGEEFVVFLPDTDSKGVEAVAQKLLVAVREIEVSSEDGDVIPLTASLGFIAGLASFDELFSAADAALYEAKNSGRDRAIAAVSADDDGKVLPASPTIRAGDSS